MRRIAPILVVLFSITMLGCDDAFNTPGTSNPGSLQGTTTGTGTYLSVNGDVKIECPQDWTIVDLNDDADIEVGDNNEELYVIVMSLPKIDFAGDRDVYSQEVRGLLVHGTANVLQNNTGVTTVAGHPAVQYKISATIDRMNYMYLHTVIETETFYHQVLTWSSPSKFMQHEALFNTITESLEEVTQEP